MKDKVMKKEIHMSGWSKSSNTAQVRFHLMVLDDPSKGNSSELSLSADKFCGIGVVRPERSEGTSIASEFGGVIF